MSEKKARIAVLTYPMLFQTHGGLKMKVEATVEALNQLGVDATLINPVIDRLVDYDLVHVFAAFNGNHRAVEQAKAFGLPVIVSPILMPPETKWHRVRAELLHRMVRKLSGWTRTTDYGQIRSALDGADHLIALGKGEKRLLIEGYGQSAERITIVPNGVGQRFFEAAPDRFEKEFSILHPFVLHVGIMGHTKNQLGLVRALKSENVGIAFIGPSSENDAEYLEQCLAEGGEKVRYLGEMSHDDPLLASAYAAADVFALPSTSEGMSNAVLESLAVGTPVVMTNNHSFDYDPDPDVVAEVDPSDETDIRENVLRLLRNRPSREKCVEKVSSLDWNNVARKINDIYEKVLGQK